MEPGYGRYQASTQVKVLSPEIILPSRGRHANCTWKAVFFSSALARRRELGGVEDRCMIPQRMDRNLGEP